MKRNYLKNTFLSQLHLKGPLEVLKSSIGKIEDIEMLDKIISYLRSEDIADFFTILATSTYNLNQTSLSYLIHKFPLDKNAYLLLKDLKFQANLTDLHLKDRSFLLNYCYAREQLEDYENFELFNGIDISTIQLSSKDLKIQSDDFSIDIYYQILKKMIFNLKMGKITKFNFNSIKCYLSNEDLDTISNTHPNSYNTTLSIILISTFSLLIKDSLLKSIINENGRVNAHSYCISDLLVVHFKQIYNLDNKESVLVQLCQTNSYDGRCKICNRLASANQIMNNDRNSQASNSCQHTSQNNPNNGLRNTLKVLSVNDQSLMSLSSPEFNLMATKLIENTLIEGDADFELIYKILNHCPWLRTAKYFKICLKQYIANNENNKSVKEDLVYLPNSKKSGKTTSKNLHHLLIDLFEMNLENEAIAISFLKASSSYLSKAISIIPILMKTTKLYFSCFIVLLEAYESSAYVKVVSKNLIQRYNMKFTSIINLILEYFIKVYKKDDNPSELIIMDKEYLHSKLLILSNLFSESPESFLSRNIHPIFNAFYPSEHFTQNYIQSNIKYLVIQKINENSYSEHVDDVDILVGLLFQDHFKGLDVFFKPSVNIFIKKNLSHILFKIKNAYSLKLYNRSSCIYKVMKFILSHINIPLYFSYTWPYLEFFLNCEYCMCAGHVLDWLRGFYNSSLMSPYLMMPFENIEDFPLLPNIETKIYPMLSRFFTSYKIPFEYSKCPFNGNYKFESTRTELEKAEISNSYIKKPELDSKTPEFNSSIQKLYISIKECVLIYSPKPLIEDESFIENFLINFKKNKGFKSKICKLHSSIIPVEAKALFGNIKYDENVDSFPKAPENIPKAILENFLLKINYERQDLFAFTIQEFLKNINEPFEPEIENFVQQFRHTKFEYKFVLKEYESIDFTSYRNFLESLFYILYSKIKRIPFFKYLVLFDDSTVGFSCLCMIKIISDTSISFCTAIFKDIATNNLEILQFLLKINTFVGKPIVEKGDVLNYSLRARDFYSLIYCLEDSETDHNLLQLSYFMINDLVRVAGFNTASTMKCYSTFNLFFDFIIDKNYKAGRACLNEMSQEEVLRCGKNISLKSSITEDNLSVESAKNQVSSLSINEKNLFIFKILKEVVDGNADFEVETLISGKYKNHPGVIHHILKDLELLSKSKNYEKTIQLINERREIADNSYLILKIHKFLESKIGIDNFTKSVDQELINYYIQRKEYLRAEEEIAKFLLKKDFSALFNLAQIKIATKRLDEAKELLKRMQTRCKVSSQDYFKATVKLCEICPSKATFETSVTTLEENLCELVGESKEEYGDFSTQKSTVSSSIAKNKVALLKLENIVANLERKQMANSAAGCQVSDSAQKATMQHAIELFNHLQKLYFLTAKYFEKHSQIVSIKYYFKSFISNNEAIPRFFHLIASIPKVQFKIIGEMIEIISKEYLANLIPFYKQISAKVALDTDSSKFFKIIVAEMLEVYPYQTHWNSLFLYNSKKVEVVKLMAGIVDRLNIERRSFFLNIKNCSEKLTAIAKSSGTSLSMENFPDVRNLFPAHVNVPGQMTEINNIKNEIVVFRSLQMPKKITFIGEDGKDYPMIAKFKDDLRKDSRFMDLDDLLNKLFDEGYYIRKYNVIPFTHESGIIEFVPNLINLKDIVLPSHPTMIETMQRFLKTKTIGGNNMETIEKMFKPVYNRYLKEVYKDPYQFYKNRENYIKTYAIMNIVGWYMGLGDRHAENIHFDSINGDTVHVDLNCIFERGKALDIPERVSFRLTQNLVDGFGVLKLEGTYKQTLKYTLNLLKENRDVIQANLLSFVFDPLLEWSRKKTEPTKILEGLDLKLEFEDADHKIEELITEATDYNNLGSMYIGWMAFL